MEPFLKRLVLEHKQLVNKTEKLTAFCESPNFENVNSVQQSLLRVQLNAMHTYATCLNERLLALGVTDDQYKAAGDDGGTPTDGNGG